MKILWFRVFWKFAHFRKFYTTTSPLTFLIPPYTAIKWIIACILWLEKDTYNERFSDLKIWVKIDSNLLNKNMFGINYLNTKTWEWHIQVKMETIINPSYIIFIWNEWFTEYDKFKNYLEKNIWEYTPYLWITEFIANINFIWEIDVDKVYWETVVIDSIISNDYFNDWENIILEENLDIEFENIPYNMDNNRKILGLKEFLYNPKWNSIKLKKVDYYKFNNNNILLC